MEQIGVDKIWEENYAYQTKVSVNPNLYKNGLEPYPVVENLEHWVNNEVAVAKTQSMRFLSEMYFHRKEIRANYIDNGYFFTPADGVITNVNEKIDAKAPLVEVKGVKFSLADLMQDEYLEGDWLVITIFMTFYSQHYNAIPYSGMRTWEDLPQLQTYNLPMLAMERELMKGVVNPEFEGNYLKKNARRISTIYSPTIDTEYNVIQIADYDVDSFVETSQVDCEDPTFFKQNSVFGKITYGSSCILAIPLIEGHLKMKLHPFAKVGNVVKIQRTPLVKVCWDEVYGSGEVQKVEEDY